MDREREGRASKAHAEDQWLLAAALGIAGALAVVFSACGAGPVDPAEAPRPRDEPATVTAFPPEQHGDDAPSLDSAPTPSSGTEAPPKEPNPATSGPRP